MELYGFLSTILFYISLPFYYAERVIHKKSFGWNEKFGNINFPYKNEKVIMMHGVSVGEVIALENLAKKIKETFPEYKLVVTTGTKTGQDIANKKYKNIADFITYFPFDIPHCTDKFLTNIKPSVVLIAETELWPNFAYKCKQNNIPIAIINGRISDSTYKSYKIAAPFFKQVFKNFTAVYAQSIEDKEKYISIGMPAEKTEVMGNLKFDVKKKEADIQIGQDGYKIIIAGSTHKGEDEIVLNTFKKLKSEFSDTKLLLAPRHPNRVPAIIPLLEKSGINYGKRSENDTFKEKDLIILDTLGELGKMYSICNFAFIGGSFNHTGGHNPLEASVYNKPVISGPDVHNFKDIYSILGKTNAGKVVKTPDEFYSEAHKLLSDKEFYTQACKDCERVFKEQQGALDFVINKLQNILH